MGNLLCISTRKMWSFLACCLLLGCFAQGASAQDYLWTVTSGGTFQGSTPSEACGVFFDFQSNYNQDWIVQNRRTEFINDLQFRCVADQQHKHSSLFYERNILALAYRSGDSCPTPQHTYNTATGACDPPASACQQKAGQTTSWTLLRPDLNGLGPIEHACMDNCRIALGNSTCTPAYEGAKTGVCVGTGQFTGSDCQPSDNPTGGTPPTDPNPPKDPDEPDEPPPTCGPGFSWSGTTCVKDPPKQCDPSTGEVCPPTDPDDPKDPTEPKDPGGDGDGDGDGDGGDGDGNGGTCDPKTDPKKCQTNPKPDDNNLPCDPAKDPNKCGQSTVGGEACDASVTCTGDAIQCAVLRQQKKQTCADEDFRKVDEKAVNDLRTAVAANQSDESFQPMKATSENTFDLSRMIDTSSRFSKSCPAIPDWSIPWLDGKNVAVRMSWVNDLCQYLIWMGYLIVAFGMRRAAEIIAGGMN